MFADDACFPQSDGGAEVEGALVVVDVRTGGVAALMGGRENDTALAYNRATRIRRQPGSLIKPVIAYAPALESGYTAATMLLDEETDFDGYKPGNSGGQYRGWVTMRQAVTSSLNVPAVSVMADIGIERGKRFAQSVGIAFDERDRSLALALGGFTYGVSPYQMAAALCGVRLRRRVCRAVAHLRHLRRGRERPVQLRARAQARHARGQRLHPHQHAGERRADRHGPPPWRAGHPAGRQDRHHGR